MIESHVTNQESDDLRERAMVSLKKKRDFLGHLLTFVLVNGMLVVIWAFTGHGFFWPIFPIVGWGTGVIFHGWDVYRGEPSEEAIRKEMERLR